MKFHTSPSLHHRPLLSTRDFPPLWSPVKTHTAILMCTQTWKLLRLKPPGQPLNTQETAAVYKLPTLLCLRGLPVTLNFASFVITSSQKLSWVDLPPCFILSRSQVLLFRISSQNQPQTHKKLCLRLCFLADWSKTQSYYVHTNHEDKRQTEKKKTNHVIIIATISELNCGLYFMCIGPLDVQTNVLCVLSDRTPDTTISLPNLYRTGPIVTQTIRFWKRERIWG